MEDIGKTLGCVFAIAIFGITSFVIYIGYFIFDKTGVQEIESKEIIIPQIKLETDGKKIDTVYIYKFK